MAPPNNPDTIVQRRLAKSRSVFLQRELTAQTFNFQHGRETTLKIELRNGKLSNDPTRFFFSLLKALRVVWQKKKCNEGKRAVRYSIKSFEPCVQQMFFWIPCLRFSDLLFSKRLICFEKKKKKASDESVRWATWKCLLQSSLCSREETLARIHFPLHSKTIQRARVIEWNCLPRTNYVLISTDYKTNVKENANDISTRKSTCLFYPERRFAVACHTFSRISHVKTSLYLLRK